MPAGTSRPKQARRPAPRGGQEWHERDRTFGISRLTTEFPLIRRSSHVFRRLEESGSPSTRGALHEAPSEEDVDGQTRAPLVGGIGKPDASLNIHRNRP